MQVSVVAVEAEIDLRNKQGLRVSQAAAAAAKLVDEKPVPKKESAKSRVRKTICLVLESAFPLCLFWSDMPFSRMRYLHSCVLLGL